jgi:hypothetical protein
MQQLMPTYDAAKADAEVDLQRTNEATNADLERRGFYNSGAGATMMQRNRESMDRGLAGQLADLRRQAVSATNDAMARQLQAAGLLGDWYQSDRGFNQVSATDQAKLTLDKDLGERGLDIQQQNANTNKFSAESQDYGMREGLKLDEAKFQESIKQFWAQIGEQQADRAARSSQFWAGLGLDERKLSLAEKSQALEATIQQGELELAQNKQLSEDKLIKRGQAMEDMRTKSDAYGYVDALLQKANDPNTKNKPTKDSIMKMIKPYDDKEVFGDLYGELKSSVDGAFKAPAATSSSYTNPKITTGRGALTDAVANAGANWWNNLWGK